MSSPKEYSENRTKNNISQKNVKQDFYNLTFFFILTNYLTSMIFPHTTSNVSC